MTITFQYDRKKVIQALRYHFVSKKEIRILIILINVFALFAAAMFFWKKIAPIAFLMSSFLWFLLMLTIWFILPFTIYQRARTFKDSFRISFLDDYMHLENSMGSKDWTYRSFQYFLETPHFFHLYIDERSFFLIPKTAFADSDAEHEFRMFLANKIKKS